MLNSYGQKAFQGSVLGAAHVSSAVSVQTHSKSLQLFRYQPQSQQVQSLACAAHVPCPLSKGIYKDIIQHLQALLQGRNPTPWVT